MTCKFNSLYFSDDSYVVKCKDCGHYQLAFISSMLTLTETAFELLRKKVKLQYSDAGNLVSAENKSIILKTPYSGACMLLTQKETNRLHEILEEADSEYKALMMIQLFNHK